MASMVPFQKESAAVDEAAEHAIALVQQFAALDPHDKAWQQPQEILAQLDQARQKLSQAWDDLQTAMDKEEEKDVSEKDKSNPNNKKEQQLDEQQDLRASYIDMITDAFADVLDEMRQKEGDNLDIDILVDCLQSGLDLLSQDEKEWFMNSDRSSTTGSSSEKWLDNDDSLNLTPHERRRRQLGFNVQMPA